MSEEKIIEKLNEHDKKFDKIEAVLDKHTAILDKHTEKFIEHDARFDRMESKMDEGFRKMTEMLESLAVMVKKIDEDHKFALEWMKRMQSELDEQRKVINNHQEVLEKIKMQLNIV